MRKVNRLKYIIIAFLLGLIAIMFGGGGIASAENISVYTNVLSDLMTDENFSTIDYPVNNNDYSLSVIQIAESTAGELILYVYQPCISLDLTATCVNMSFSESVDNTDIYNLELLNRGGTLAKYKVKNVMVGNADIRYYNISSIYRKWVKGIDSDTINDNTINEVSFEVGFLWTVTTDNGNITYEKCKLETIEIIDKYLGSVRYFEGFSWFTEGACDSHYVAFSTNKNIDNLYEADLCFTSQFCVETINFMSVSGSLKKDAPITSTITLTDKQTATTSPYGWLRGKEENYCRILSSVDFCSQVELDNEVKIEVLKNKWVLRFYESSYSSTYLTIKQTNKYTEVSEVSILRLKFETAGKVYNLGVVDNKQTGSNIPSIQGSELAWWQILLIVIAVVLVLGIILKLLSLVLPVFGVILRGLWFVLTSPIRLIIWIIKKIRGE